MEERATRNVIGFLKTVLVLGALFWVSAHAATVSAYDYGRGTYGSGAYNIGQLPATTTVLQSSANPSTEGDSIRLTATVAPSTATGTVTFKDGSTTIGTATLGQGSGSIVTAALSAGTHSLTALYAGNLSFSGSLSNTVTQIVSAAASGGNSGTSGGGGGRGGGGRGSRSGTANPPVPTSPSASAGSSSSATSSSQDATRFSVNVEGRMIVYHDVQSDAWFAPYVSMLIEQDIARGYRDAEGNLTGEFGAANPVTGAEILKMALTAADRPLSTGVPRNRFARSDWSAGYVKTAEDLGLSVYRPAYDVRTPATRAEVVQTILEAFGTPLTGLSSTFRDLPANHPQYAAIATAQSLGLISGDTDVMGNPNGFFRPDAPINRAEAAKIVVLALSLLKH